MADKARRIGRRPVKTLAVDEALIAVFIGAMNANDTTLRAKNWPAPII